MIAITEKMTGKLGTTTQVVNPEPTWQQKKKKNERNFGSYKSINNECRLH